MRGVSVPLQRRSIGGGLLRSPRLPLVGLLFVALAGLATAQTGTPRRTVWDGVYAEAQAARGAAAFGQSCAGCHALTAEGKAPLVGDAFWKSFAQKSVGDLLEFVSANMPNGAPARSTNPPTGISSRSC